MGKFVAYTIEIFLLYWFLMLNKTVYNGGQVFSQAESSLGARAPPFFLDFPYGILLVIYDITERCLSRREETGNRRSGGGGGERTAAYDKIEFPPVG